MSDVWRCPVWHPGECEGTPSCPPRCPRYVTEQGTTITIFGDDADRLVAVDDTGDPLAGVSYEDGTAEVELSTAAEIDVAVEVIRQTIARGHERSDTRLIIEAEMAVLESIIPEVAEAVIKHEPGRLLVDPSHPTVSALTLAPARGATTPSATRVEPLVNPDVVAVFGATDRHGSIGRVLMENLESFEGTVLPVSDRQDSVLGWSTVDSLEGHSVDLAVIALPAAVVPTTIESIIQANVSTVAILSAGFGESDEAGEALENTLATQLEQASITTIGPNAIGVVSTRGSLNATFAPSMPSAGALSIVSHSGAMMVAMLDWAASTDIGIRDAVSLGNQLDLTAAELIRFWGRDEQTEIIAAYLEDLPDGRAFVEAARDVTPTTPIVALKAGRTEVGAVAAASHTGAMAGDDSGYVAAFDAAGVIRAAGQDELFDLVAALDSVPIPRGDQVAVVTNAGGPGVIAADALAETDLELAEFTPETAAKLRVALPHAAGIDNPVDVLGDADIDRFVLAVETVLQDPGVDSVVVTSAPHPLVSLPTLVDALDDLVDRYRLPIFTTFSGVDDPALTKAIRMASVAHASDAGRTARTIEKLTRYHRNRRRPRAGIDPIGADRDIVSQYLTSMLETGHNRLGVESLSLLEAYEVTVADTSIVDDPIECATVIDSFEDDAVLKLAIPSLAHKSDIGGVITDVGDEDADNAFEQLQQAAGSLEIDLPVKVAIQESIEEGVELLVGVTSHPRFGPIVTVGLGGVLVETLDDVAHGLAPLSTQSARELLASLAGADLIESGPRGGDPPNIEAIAEAIARLSRLAADHEEIHTLEVNPLIATADAAIAVDLVVELGQ